MSTRCESQFGSRACFSSSAACSDGAAMQRCCCSRAATSRWWGTLVAGCGHSWARFPSHQRRGVSCSRHCSPTFAMSSQPPMAGTSTRSSPVRGYTEPKHPPPACKWAPDRWTRCHRRQSGQAEARHGGDAARYASHCTRGVRAALRLVRGRAPGGLARKSPRIHRGGVPADGGTTMQTMVN